MVVSNKRYLEHDFLRQLLFEIGDELNSRGKSAEIALYGGSALLLTLNFRETTKDVDYIELVDESFELQEISRQIGNNYGLDDDWLNDAVKIFSSPKGEYVWYGDFPPNQPGLRVFAAKPEYILAMKLMAMRSSFEANDIKDIWMLIDHCEIADVDDAQRWIKQYYPGDELPERNVEILKDIFVSKHAGEEFNQMIGW